MRKSVPNAHRSNLPPALWPQPSASNPASIQRSGLAGTRVPRADMKTIAHARHRGSTFHAWRPFSLMPFYFLPESNILQLQAGSYPYARLNCTCLITSVRMRRWISAASSDFVPAKSWTRTGPQCDLATAMCWRCRLSP